MLNKRQIGSVLLSACLVTGLFSVAPSVSANAPVPITPVDMGEAVKIPLSQGASFGQRADGTNEMYVFVAGSPGTFYAVEAENGKRIFSQEIPGADVVTAVMTAPDGQVYFAGPRNMYNYDPNTRTVKDLGANPTGSSTIWELEASKDGKIYGATYPNSKVFEYDIASGIYKDLGTMVEGQQYARGIGVTEDYVYVGVGTTAALVRYDRKSGEKVNLPIPNEGKSVIIADIQIYGGKLLVRSGTSELFVIEQATNKHIRTLAYDSLVSPPSPHNTDLIYYKKGTSFYSYNLKMDENKLIEGVPALPSTAFKNYAWVTLKEGPEAGQTVLTAMAAYTETMFYNPVSGSFRMITPDVDAKGVEVQSLEQGPDGKLYIGGFQRGLSIFDPSTEQYETTLPAFHQTEGMSTYNHKMYFGTYGGAVIYRFDPSKPLDYRNGAAGGNPDMVYDIGDEQDRPFVMEEGDGKLYIGTIPGYGQLGGALTVLEEDASGKVKAKVHRNIVQDQSIIGLAYRDGKVYGGTSISGGGGSQPSAAEAKWFVWDAKTETKIGEYSLSIPGLSRAPKMIGDLSWGPDGLLWGAADVDGLIFAIDPDNGQVVKSKRLSPEANTGSVWRPFYLRWGSDGMLYTTAGRQLTAVDPVTMESHKLMDGVNLMTISDNGSIYYSKGPSLYKLPFAAADHESLVTLIGKLAASGDIKNSLKQQMLNTLKTAKHHKDSGRDEQAAQHYGKFLSTLRGSGDKVITADARKQVLGVAEALAPRYMGE